MAEHNLWEPLCIIYDTNVHGSDRQTDNLNNVYLFLVRVNKTTTNIKLFNKL